MKFIFVKRETASEAVLNFLLVSVVTVIATRIFLKVFSNPAIVFGVWHLAHVLWGGLLMLISLILLLAFEGQGLRRTSIVVGGIGWGLFVDEIGKFVTRDNDYWFRPAILMIYISFIIIFLVYRRLEKFQPKDDLSELYWMIERLERSAEGKLQDKDKKNTLKRIDMFLGQIRSEKSRVLASSIRKILANSETIPDKQYPAIGRALAGFFNQTYNKILKRKVVMVGLWVYAVYYGLEKIIEAVILLTSSEKMAMIEKFYSDYDFFGRSDVYMLVFKIIFDVISSVLFLAGASYFWSKKRVKGIRFFQFGLLIGILLSGPIKFYFEQYGAFTDIVLSMVVYQLLLRYKRETVKWS